jgi:hypothetical protein
MPPGASRMRAGKCPVCRGEAGTTEAGGWVVTGDERGGAEGMSGGCRGGDGACEAPSVPIALESLRMSDTVRYTAGSKTNR